MGLDADYGSTPIDGEELDQLEPTLLDLLGAAVTKAQIYDLEATLLQEARINRMSLITDGTLTIDAILKPQFVRQLHADLYAGIWRWAGRYRHTYLNIGVDPHEIQTAVTVAMDNLLYQWRETTLLDAHQLGIATHAELVRIHPFVDGNGRATRLMADLVFAATQDQSEAREFDWNVDKQQYIGLLKLYDANRDPSPLAQFIGTVARRRAR